MKQEIRFCSADDGVRIAYALAGEGSPVVKAANWLNHLEFDWDSPIWRHTLEPIARRHLLVRYDERGNGLSDWEASDLTFDAWVRDLETVVDAAALERFALLGISQGCAVSIAYAVRHPERVSRLVLYGGYARGWRARGDSDEIEVRKALHVLMEKGWGTDNPAFRQIFTSRFVPGATPEQTSWFNDLQRMTTSPENAIRLSMATADIDVHDLLPRVETPTQVLHCRGDAVVPFECGRELAMGVPGARFVPLEGRNHLILGQEPAWQKFIEEILGFLESPAPRLTEEEIAAAKNDEPHAPAPDSHVSWTEADRIFDGAIDLPPSERRAWLERACGANRDLREQVERLLRASETTDRGLATGAAMAGTFGNEVASEICGEARLSAGRKLGPYTITETLDRGGMGTVYRARHVGLDRDVAVKALSRVFGADESELHRFEREAKLLARLNHPNIATVHDLLVVDKRPYLVMELIEGRTLAEILEEGPIPLVRALSVGIQITEALSHAHDRGIVHRDLKPANVMMMKEGRLKIIDFGIAKLLDVADADASTVSRHATVPGQLVGTIAYMSPEQVRAEGMDARSDIFTLGILLYEMSTHRHPFQRETPVDTLASILRSAPPRPIQIDPGLPEALDRIVMRCLDKDPQGRYPSVREVGDELAAIRDGHRSGEDVESPARSIDSSKSFSELRRRGSESLGRQDWRNAFDLLSAADGAGNLTAEELDMLGEAAWWLGMSRECVQARERSYTAFLRENAHARAAGVALKLTEDFHHRMARSVSKGWLKQAERLLDDDIPESVEHGLLTRWRAVLALEVDGDLDRAQVLTERTIDRGERFGSDELRALGLQDRGRILVARGEASEGMAFIDEAMAVAMSGRLSPRTAGRIYCNMMDVCRALSDYRRAGEWSEVAQRWSEQHPGSCYQGICRVRRAELLRLRGAWNKAEEEARRACDELEGFLADVAGEAYYEVAEVRLRRGDYSSAEESFRQAHELGREPLPGLALLRLLEGKEDAAQFLVERALSEEAAAPLKRARLLPAHIEILLSRGEIEEASEAASELEGIAERYDTEALRASSAHALGSVSLAKGDLTTAVSRLRRARELWKRVELPYDAAKARLLLASAYRRLGSEDSARLELDAARSAFQELGAEPDVRRVDELLSA